MNRKQKSNEAKYSLNHKGYFNIENYNQSRAFCNFFPGIAGLWGIPMWVFYVNRGQCVTSFGIEDKGKAIMEFQPANKSYRLTSLQGFRTFIKVRQGRKVVYWEPFQNNLMGTAFNTKQTMAVSAHDLVLEETNFDLGLKAQVSYFTLPEEPYSALVRQVIIKNLTPKPCSVEMVDGLPVIIPYGLTEWANKNMSRTAEAWVKVRNLEQHAPFYQLNVEISDTPQVTHIHEGNFFFSFRSKAPAGQLLPVLVEAQHVFGQATDFSAPVGFLADDFRLPQKQRTNNKTPSAMSHASFDLKAKSQERIVSIFGYAHSVHQLNMIKSQIADVKLIEAKALRNQQIVDEIKNFTFTQSSSEAFNLYARHTFLDNVLRGGLPISVQTDDGPVAFNVYSRKHGDPERDYNYFNLAPTFYSQGNGNYRDVNQNRRNDVWFNTDLRSGHIITFMNLGQADGYNPLIVKGTTFAVKDTDTLKEILASSVDPHGQQVLMDFLKKDFRPGDMMTFIKKQNISLKVPAEEFLSKILRISHKHELADHGEGFWADHWTYNLDLIESYLSLYPEDLRSLLIERKDFSFYHNGHFVLPRDRRYILTDRGVRQYASVDTLEEEAMALVCAQNNVLRTKRGEGAVYTTHLTCKLLCIISNKIATLDPSGIGVEMEADKPNWYDALNGLPGLLGSSISETVEIKRFCQFLLNSFSRLSLAQDVSFDLFEELATFIRGLHDILSLEPDAHSCWSKSNDIKEWYRQHIKEGISGVDAKMPMSKIKNFLELVIQRVDWALERAKDEQGFLATYFYHEVTEYEPLDQNQNDQHPHVRPLKFKRVVLPPFLEGYVHALRVCSNREQALELYGKVRQSPLWDKKLKMYKVNAELTHQTEEIGRTRVFPSGWLENESIWLHMEYKFILELLRNELYKEFYENFKNVLVPFFKPERYGRSILENSSFLVSSAHEDESLHGQGFVARLSGSSAELIHMWLYMNLGKHPFSLDKKGQLVLRLSPALAGWMFTMKKIRISFFDSRLWQTAELPKNSYAFNLLGSILAVYHNPKRRDTYGEKKATIRKISLTYPGRKQPVELASDLIPAPYAQDVRGRKVSRIDVYWT